MSRQPPRLDAALPASLTSSAWTASAGTKFRVPQLRRDVVERVALVEQAEQLALERRLTLVCAPAGFGKSTLLAQLSARERAGFEVAWLSIDEDDNDANRLFTSILRALHGIALEWQVQPQALASQVDGSGPGSRAAVAGLINALCSYEQERLVLLVDDFHRITDARALRLIDEIVDRLPPEVGMVVGSRVEPDLSLARWRVRGELGELRMPDLQFNEADARCFAEARLAAAATPDVVREALARTEGWAAGLQLLFGSAHANARAAGQSLGGQGARRHLFDFFAQEVLAELPQDVREFVLQCSILPELTPPLCAAVSGRSDARDVLDDLYRRHLFLVALDNDVSTLRFHDLFRDFLTHELERRWPQRVPELHARAAQVETISPRAVSHWLKARRWNDALELMGRCAKPLLAEGGHAMVERWIEQLPPEVRQTRPEVAHLLGLCAWTHWDWLTVRPLLERACEGYRTLGNQSAYVDALGVLGACYNGLAELPAAARVLQEADQFVLGAAARVPFDTLHAWHALAQGRLHDVARWLEATAADVEQDLSTIYPDVIDMSHGHYAGIPGALAPMRQLQALCRHPRSHEATHWSSAIVAQGAWLEFWQGQREAAGVALEEQRTLQRQLPGALALVMSSHHLRAFHLAVAGQHDQAAEEARAMLQVLEAPHARTLKASWGRSYLHVLARLHWIAQDGAALQSLFPLLQAQRHVLEWPVHDMGRAMVRGQSALLAGNLAAAETALEEAVSLHECFRLPSFMGDPRPGLAMLRLAQGDAPAAWDAFAPVLDEALREDSLGALLLEPPVRLAQLLALAPAAERGRLGLVPLLARLAGWHQAQGQAQAAQRKAQDERWRGLTGREREVLALLGEGLSNKLIARRLDLSLHTVKRHVANILGKLDAGSRAQAAHWFREHSD